MEAKVILMRSEAMSFWRTTRSPLVEKLLGSSQMISTVLVTALAFAILMALMAVGLMLGGKELRGSCGGNPDSVHCGCSPEKKAACRAEAQIRGDEDEDDVFSGPPLTAEHLAPPGEERLIQLRTGRR
jgi:hypothetical protein